MSLKIIFVALDVQRLKKERKTEKQIGRKTDRQKDGKTDRQKNR